MKDEWLSKTYGYQSTHFGIDYHRMNGDIDYRMDYLKTNLFAAMLEVGEAAAETPWKPWASTSEEERERLFADGRDRLVGELVDALFFIANALTAANVTDTELSDRYAAKKAVNEGRQASGTYNGMTTDKCDRDGCTRATDEPGNDYVTTHIGRFCSVDCAMRAGSDPAHAYIKRTVKPVSNDDRIQR
jgi:hypothetical protein